MADVCDQMHVVNVYDDHSDAMSRKIVQAEGRVQFERRPGVSLERVTQFSFLAERRRKHPHP